MTTLFLDCGMGAAGDMLTAALLELLPEREEFLAELNRLGIPGVSFSAEESEKCGIRGTRMIVKVNGGEESAEMHAHGTDHAHGSDHGGEHAHAHSGLHDIERVAESLPVSDRVKADLLAVYSQIAEAESHVHGVPVTEVHFHEVGAMDAAADITAVCMLMDRLRPGRVVVSPVSVGSGQVQCAHGILPVPAPATAFLLRGAPIRGGEFSGELCTPTGAALLTHFATEFGELPEMKVERIGYGMGKKDFPAANCVRAFLGETEESGDTVSELVCNLDDMTPEAIGFAQESLYAAGALEVFTVPAQMKKTRPGHLLTVLCRETDKEKMIRQVFRYTSTLGIRETVCRRYTLSRSEETVMTRFGPVRVKRSEGYGTQKEKYEYEDVARLARDNKMNLEEVFSSITGKES